MGVPTGYLITSGGEAALCGPMHHCVHLRGILDGHHNVRGQAAIRSTGSEGEVGPAERSTHNNYINNQDTTRANFELSVELNNTEGVAESSSPQLTCVNRVFTISQIV